jgi:pimeloyl-ACP methyl ester carboxylesterase
VVARPCAPERVDLQIELGPGFRLGAGLSCAVTIFPPRGTPSALIFCYPGGGYGKEYFDLRPGSRPGYSMAEWLRDCGYLVVTCDHLGVGGSSHPAHPEQITPQDLADANSIVVRELRDRLGRGTVPPLAPLPRLPAVGIAHSMGGGIITIHQARHGDFDALVTMGWSAVSMPNSEQKTRQEGIAPAPRAVITPAATPINPGYRVVARGPAQHYWYHWDDVPASIIELDDAAAVEFPPCAARMNEPGVVAREAMSVTAPVLLIFGERDLRLDNSDETAAYSRAHGVSSLVVERAGHCQNFASTRRHMWRAIDDWLGEQRIVAVAS